MSEYSRIRAGTHTLDDECPVNINLGGKLATITNGFLWRITRANLLDHINSYFNESDLGSLAVEENFRNAHFEEYMAVSGAYSTAESLFFPRHTKEGYSLFSVVQQREFYFRPFLPDQVRASIGAVGGSYEKFKLEIPAAAVYRVHGLKVGLGLIDQSRPDTLQCSWGNFPNEDLSVETEETAFKWQHAKQIGPNDKDHAVIVDRFTRLVYAQPIAKPIGSRA